MSNNVLFTTQFGAKNRVGYYFVFDIPESDYQKFKDAVDLNTSSKLADQYKYELKEQYGTEYYKIPSLALPYDIPPDTSLFVLII